MEELPLPPLVAGAWGGGKLLENGDEGETRKKKEKKKKSKDDPYRVHDKVCGEARGGRKINFEDNNVKCVMDPSLINFCLLVHVRI